MSTTQDRAAEKSPVEEKSAYDLQEVTTQQLSESPSGSQHSTSNVLAKPRLPYTWQLTMIILTCLCTCESHELSFDTAIVLMLVVFQSVTTGRT